jgi:hypothetical protein
VFVDSHAVPSDVASAPLFCSLLDPGSEAYGVSGVQVRIHSHAVGRLCRLCHWQCRAYEKALSTKTPAETRLDDVPRHYVRFLRQMDPS